MPICLTVCCDTVVWQPKQAHHRHFYGISSGVIGWCSRLGTISRHSRPPFGIQQQLFHLRCLCSHCRSNAELCLLCRHVSDPDSLFYAIGPFSYSHRVAIYSAADGGNYILDTTNLIEFLPVSHLWLTTFLALWWAVSYTITGLLAWAFLGNYTCHSDATICTNRENMGWRYLHFTCGGLITVLAILRIFMIHMPQTPKWLITQNRDAEVFDILKNIVDSYKRPFSLTLQQLEEPGHVLNAEKSVWSSVRLQKHFSGLFATHRLAYSTYVINLNWFLVGIVSPLYTIYLPYYLASRGADTGSDDSTYITWRNYAINQVCGLIGPIIAGGLVETKYLGREEPSLLAPQLPQRCNSAIPRSKLRCKM